MLNTRDVHEIAKIDDKPDAEELKKSDSIHLENGDSLSIHTQEIRKCRSGRID